MKKVSLSAILLLIIFFNTAVSYAQTTSWKGSVNQNWNLAANWTNGIPDNTKDVIIGDANFTGTFQPKVNVVSTCKSVSVGGTIAATLTLTRALTITGNFTINANGIVDHPGSTLTLAGNFTNNGSYTTLANSSRTIFNGTAQTISGSSVPVFRLLVINATSTVTLGTNISVTGASSNFGVYGTVDPGTLYQVSSTGLSRIYTGGKLKVYAANFNSNYLLTGTTTLYAGSVVDYCAAGDQVISAAYSYSTLLINGSGVKSLSANLPPLYSKDNTNGKIYVNSGTFDLLGFTANRGTTKVGGELFIADGALVKVGGTNNFPANFSVRTIGVSSTVEYNGADQTVSAQSYGNLLFSTAGIKTATSSFSTMGNLTIANGTLNMNTTNVNHNIAGNFIISGGNVSGTAYSFTMNGTGTQTINTTESLLKLTVNNNGGVVNLASNLTVNNTLQFTKGNISTGAFMVIMPSTASVSGAAQNTGWVNGNLRKAVATGAVVFKTFEIGGANYAPASVLLSTVTVGGDLSVYTNEADQSEINYSGLNPLKSVNRFWSFDNGGVVFNNATVIFNWASADLDAGVNTANFKIGLYKTAAWSMPVTSSPLATSIQANGLLQLGDFSVAEILGKSQWTGDAMTSDWFTPKNWLGLIPSTSYPTYINNDLGAGRVFPVLTAGAGIVNDLFVENGASLTVSSGTLKVAGAVSSVGGIDATNGTVEFNGSSYQSITSGTFSGNTIKNLTVNNNLGLEDITIVTGTVTVGNGKTFSTSDNLVLKSDANGTANVAALPVDGFGNATAFINGNVSVERYIPARKAWRLLSAPIASSTITLQDTWQESVYGPPSLQRNLNPNPGYGIHICGGPLVNGFDQSPTNSATCKIFNTASNSFVALPTTPGTYTTVNTYPGYMVYIRGDRGIDLSQGNNAAVTATTLRMKGPVKTGNQASTVNATGFTVVGNPYPSAIDFATITRNNVKNSFYVWDPKLNGSNGLGGYVTVSWNSGTNSYDITTSASPVSQYIPSGEAFMVESQDGTNPGTITIKESDKTSNGSDALFGRQPVAGERLRVNLYEQHIDGSIALLDGTMNTYNENNSNSLDNQDVKKLVSEGKQISFRTEGQLLAIQRRKTISEEETNQLNITALKPGVYTIEVIAENLQKPGLEAIITDRFASSINNTVLNSNGTTQIQFEVTENPASYAADRFSIVFRNSSVTGKLFAFTAITAGQQQKNIQLEWQTINEMDITSYTVERSTDGNRFSYVTSISCNKIKNAAAYSWFDLHPATGDYYYRIKAESRQAVVTYSNAVKVSLSETPLGAGEMMVYPNPVKNNKVSLSVGNLETGVYLVQVLNINGQVVKRFTTTHPGGDMRYSFNIDGNLAAGKYQLQLIGAKKNFTISFIKE
ncbi:MAG: T9SS type A sorting domain-containing protein [Bacteroidetes bacterium]|nr:T9SS type A sorting domain-containing protein [Bacteroidota bacterium]